MSTGASQTSLYRHTRCPQWGLGIVLERRPDRVEMRFQDGHTRTIREDFLHFLEPVEKPEDVADRVASTLASQATSNEAPVRASAAEVSLEDQIAWFASQYPAGFGDATWIRGFRARPGERRVKRLREPACEEARILLGQTPLEAAKDPEVAQRLVSEIMLMLNRTDLCTRRDLEPLASMPQERTVPFLEVLAALLYGEEALFDRFTRLMAALDHGAGPAPTWPLATAFMALLYPTEHIVVRPAPFKDQAKSASPGLVFEMLPNAALYRRILEMCQKIQAKLVEAGHTPADLFDVYDFICQSLKRSARDAQSAS